MGFIGKIIKAGKDFFKSDIVKGAVAGEALGRGIDALLEDDDKQENNSGYPPHELFKYKGALETEIEERETSFWDEPDDDDSGFFKGALDIEIEEKESSFSFFEDSSSSDDDDW